MNLQNNLALMCIILLTSITNLQGAAIAQDGTNNMPKMSDLRFTTDMGGGTLHLFPGGRFEAVSKQKGQSGIQVTKGRYGTRGGSFVMTSYDVKGAPEVEVSLVPKFVAGQLVLEGDDASVVKATDKAERMLLRGVKRIETGVEPGDNETALQALVRMEMIAIAKTVLKTWKSKDLKSLAMTLPPANQQQVLKMAELGNDHPQNERMFQGWRWEAIDKWDGKIRGVRFRTKEGDRVLDNPAAYVWFAESKDEVYVVTLQMIEGRWYFEDILSPDRQIFANLEDVFSAAPENGATDGSVTTTHDGIKVSVQFPSAPKQVFGVGKKPSEEQHLFQLGRSNGVMMIAIQDFPEQDLSLDKVVDAFQKTIGGELSARREVELKLDGIVGTEIDFDIPARSGVAKSRMYLIGKRWVHVVSMGAGDFVGSEESRKFLESVVIENVSQN